ncbi:MAG: RecQ family zinc-binding domain-containing protein [Elusimicrobia bacterium]|nr:RecQ family zinc-binding domain-containing protein [Elusimicrobiota bacterium]
MLLHAFRDRFTHEYFIKSAHARRDVTERLYDLVRRGGPRLTALAPEALARKLGSGTNARDVEAALRLLERAGAWRPASASGLRVHVRLLATAQRIRDELGEDRALELGLLRALWRLGGERLYDGLGLDLDGLPPALGGPQALDMLDRLQGGQFVEWSRLEAAPTLTRPAAGLDQFRIDWTSQERRRKADLDKLETMQRYAYTERCRRAFVLRYFGDPSERPECGACDNCIRRSERGPARARSARARPEHRYISTDDVLVVAPPEPEPQRTPRRGRDAGAS